MSESETGDIGGDLLDGFVLSVRQNDDSNISRVISKVRAESVDSSRMIVGCSAVQIYDLQTQSIVSEPGPRHFGQLGGIQEVTFE